MANSFYFLLYRMSGSCAILSQLLKTMTSSFSLKNQFIINYTKKCCVFVILLYISKTSRQTFCNIPDPKCISTQKQEKKNTQCIIRLTHRLTTSVRSLCSSLFLFLYLIMFSLPLAFSWWLSDNQNLVVHISFQKAANSHGRPCCMFARARI